MQNAVSYIVMALDEYQQAYRSLGNSSNVLIIAGHKDIEDTCAAAIALRKVLKKNKKKVSLFSLCEIPEHFSFLEQDKKFKKNIAGSRDIIVSIDVSQKPVKQITYKRADSRLNVHITPKSGTMLTEQDVHVGLSKFDYDLILALGLDDLESLKYEFESNAQLFFETPIINIDKNSSNERYGQINIIEPTISSCSEITASFLRGWQEGLIEKDVATSLLAGIITATHNFQNSRTKPSTLYEAAYLMSCEADQQEIIKRFFKTKSFGFLKLWGTAMAKLKYEEDGGLAWLSISDSDFSESGMTPKAIPEILAELKNNFSQASFFIIFWDGPRSSFAIAHTPYAERLALLAKSTGGEMRNNNLVFAVSSPDQSFKQNLIRSIIKSWQ
jgi:nanoRNase/pAp phosphatase (c-di-AMP/oligoRNAs hydrolase)